MLVNQVLKYVLDNYPCDKQGYCNRVLDFLPCKQLCPQDLRTKFDEIFYDNTRSDEIFLTTVLFSAQQVSTRSFFYLFCHSVVDFHVLRAVYELHPIQI